MDALEHSFGTECYKQIRAEVGVLLARIENLFRYSLLATSGVFAWLLTTAFGVMPGGTSCLKLPKEALAIAWWIPAAFIVLSGMITLAMHMRVIQMSDFLRHCEVTLGSATLSWETYLQPKPPMFTVTTTLAWILMLATAMYAAYVGLSFEGLEICRYSN